jgi:hypothetical protein
VKVVRIAYGNTSRMDFEGFVDIGNGIFDTGICGKFVYGGIGFGVDFGIVKYFG